MFARRRHLPKHCAKLVRFDSMAKEIERKFLVTDNSYREMAKGNKHIVQGYLSTEIRATVRVRIVDNRAMLTVKGRNEGITRDEWEYPIPVDDAMEMLGKITEGAIIDKVRYLVEWEGYTWEIDEFSSPVNGLVVAEVELKSGDDSPALPPFIGKEVTGDPAYYNSSMVTSR